jgi:hypothetical protein
MITATITETAADLLSAADVLERDGWCQGRLHTRGRHCTRGALNVVAGVVAASGASEAEYLAAIERSDRAEAVLARSLGLGLGPGAVPIWNDAPGRTPEEVVAALRAAAGGTP